MIDDEDAAAAKEQSTAAMQVEAVLEKAVDKAIEQAEKQISERAAPEVEWPLPWELLTRSDLGLTVSRLAATLFFETLHMHEGNTAAPGCA